MGSYRKTGITGDPADVIIRPERMSLHHPADLHPAHDDENRLDGEIVDAIYLGTHTQFVVRFADEQTSTVHVQNSSDAKRDFSIGDAAALRFSIASASLLDDG